MNNFQVLGDIETDNTTYDSLLPDEATGRTERQYYFDVVPCHPRPRPLESLTGYLTELGHLNGWRSVGMLSALLLPFQNIRVTRSIRDLPLKAQAINSLSRALACPESQLLGTTSYHLVRKFGRDCTPHAAGHFLADVLAPMLRYCPMCLSEEAYYRLTWRFLILSGCAKHGCRLLDQCGHCGRRIPLLAAPFRPAHCTSCGGDLRRCATEPLSTDAHVSAVTMSVAIESLLSAPQDSDTTNDPRNVMLTSNPPLVQMAGAGIHPNFLDTSGTVRQENSGRAPNSEEQLLAMRIGQRAAILRRARGFTRREWAKFLDMPLANLAALERGDIYWHRVNLLGYACITTRLDASLLDLFDFGDLRFMQSAEDLAREEALKRGWPWREKAQPTRSARRSEPDEDTVCGEDQLSSQKRKRKQKARWYIERDLQLAESVNAAISTLQSRGERVTQAAAAKLAGMTLPGLLRFPTPKRIMKDIARGSYRPPIHCTEHE